AAVDDAFDIDRNARVELRDLLLVRDYATSMGTALPLISPPAAASILEEEKQAVDAVMSELATATHVPQPLDSDAAPVESPNEAPQAEEIDYRALLNEMRPDRFASDSPHVAKSIRPLLADAFWSSASFWQSSPTP